SWLDIVDALGEETDYDVLDGIVGPLSFLDEQVAGDGTPLQAVLRAWVGERFLGAFTRLGWRAEGSEDDDTRLRRAALLRIVGLVAEAPAVMHEASRQREPLPPLSRGRRGRPHAAGAPPLPARARELPERGGDRRHAGGDAHVRHPH